MLGLTVLSPHRDDAAFSLMVALSRWSEMGLSIRVLNFFTISSYAPQSIASSICEISSVRDREDRRALRSIGPRIETETLGLLDAPIRLNINAASISAPENANLQPAGEIDFLARQMQAYSAFRLTIAPLALGNHIDHRAVHSAAVKAHNGQRLAFYEDLPYASWTCEEQLRTRVAETEDCTKVALKPIVVHRNASASKKLRVVSIYKSQITRPEAQAIAAFANRHGGERLWVPRHSNLWQSLLN